MEHEEDIHVIFQVAYRVNQERQNYGGEYFLTRVQIMVWGWRWF